MKDLHASTVVDAVNAGVGYGLLRVLGPANGRRSGTSSSCAACPTTSPTVAGAISLVPQTPLSHVNLRAVQDGVPNAWIRNALEDEAIAALIGKYVRLEGQGASGWPEQAPVGATYSIREATAARGGGAPCGPATGRGADADARPRRCTTYRDLDRDGLHRRRRLRRQGREPGGAADLRPGRGHGARRLRPAVPFLRCVHAAQRLLRRRRRAARQRGLPGGHRRARRGTCKKLRRRIRNGAVPDWMATRTRGAAGAVPGGHGDPLPLEHQQRGPAGLQRRRPLRLLHAPPGRPAHLSKSVRQVFASLWNLARVRGARVPPGGPQGGAPWACCCTPTTAARKSNGVAVSDDPFLGTARTASTSTPRWARSS